MPRIDIDSLKESNEFLNDLYQNVTSAIFIADSNAKIYHFNDSFRTLFYKPEDQILKQLCGNVMGCIFAVEEGKNCGDTSQCGDCILRNRILRTFTEKVPAYKEQLRRRFLISGKAIEKYFIFTTKYLNYHGNEMILVIFDDITEQEQQKEQIQAYYTRLLTELRSKIEEYSNIKEQLQNETSLKDALRLEFDHRIGNSLQIISSLMQLHLTDIRDPQVEEYCMEILNRVNVIKTLYQHLKKGSMLIEVDLYSYIHDLLDSLIENAEIQSPPLTLNRSIENMFSSIDTALPLGLILHEIISAELKEFSNTGEIELVLSDSSAESPIITVTGMSFSKGINEGSSVGTVLIEILCKQIGARFELCPSPSESSTGKRIEIRL